MTRNEPEYLVLDQLPGRNSHKREQRIALLIERTSSHPGQWVELARDCTITERSAWGALRGRVPAGAEIASRTVDGTVIVFGRQT